MQFTYHYALLALLALSACNGEKNASDSASDSSTGASATMSAGETSATTAGPTAADPTSDSATDSASEPTTGGTSQEPNPTSATTPTTDGTSTSGSTTDDVPETGVVDGIQTVIEDACAPDDGPALEFKFDVTGGDCSATWPEDAPIVRIVLFQAGPLAPGSYTLDGGNGFASFDDGNGELVVQEGKIDIIGWNQGFPVGAIDITFSPDVHLTEQFSATFCDTGALCG